VCLTGTPSLGSLSAVLALLPLLYVLPHEGGPPVLWFTMALATFVFWAHRSNIQRLLRGEESSLRQGSEDPT
jgi:glycerol-3-phosphate acyltransferase PlsY